MAGLLLLIAGLLAIVIYDGIPAARAGLWREFFTFLLVWCLALYISVATIVGVSPTTFTDWIIAAGRLLAPVRNILLPGIELF